MHGDDICPGLSEVSNALLGFHNHLHKSGQSTSVLDCMHGTEQIPYNAKTPHQVNIQRLLCHWSNGIHDKWSNGDVRYEAAIHHVNVNPVAASFIDSFDLHTGSMSYCNEYFVSVVM